MQLTEGEKWPDTCYRQAGGAGSWDRGQESRPRGRRGRVLCTTIQSAFSSACSGEPPERETAEPCVLSSSVQAAWEEGGEGRMEAGTRGGGRVRGERTDLKRVGKGGSQTAEAGLRRGAFAALSISGLSSTRDPRGPAHQ